MLVSVIVPVFNTAQYLPEALESVCSQTLTDIEVICVDDASTDESFSVLQTWSARDPRVKVVQQVVNRGTGAARNIALKEATGKYVYFFDSDDVLDPATLRNLVDRAESERLDMVFFNADPFFSGKYADDRKAAYERQYARTGVYSHVGSGVALLKAMGERLEWKPSACLYLSRRELITANSLKFSEGLLHEDNGFSMRAVLSAEAVGYDPAAYFKRRIRGGSIMTRTLSFAHLEGLTGAIVELLNAPRVVGLPEGQERNVASVIETQAELLYYDAATKFSHVDLAGQEQFHNWEPNTAILDYVRRRILERAQAHEAATRSDSAHADLVQENTRLAQENEHYRNSRAIRWARRLRRR